MPASLSCLTLSGLLQSATNTRSGFSETNTSVLSVTLFGISKTWEATLETLVSSENVVTPMSRDLSTSARRISSVGSVTEMMR